MIIRKQQPKVKLLEIKTERQLHLSGIGAHEVPGTSVNAALVSIANLSESSSSSC